MERSRVELNKWMDDKFICFPDNIETVINAYAYLTPYAFAIKCSEENLHYVAIDGHMCPSVTSFVIVTLFINDIDAVCIKHFVKITVTKAHKSARYFALEANNNYKKLGNSNRK
ncbi:Hypothetical predicted protein [Octopus vulgaris]|uniref:Uncharacterized protein n=1 Tax=Octopus vulgaris TaxID=6645 RepID=A0AA36AG82_OCTVU|nr:Hypothetical predicted protein [Octopus vulgaris]